MANLEETVLLFAKRNGLTKRGIANAIGYKSAQTLNSHINDPGRLTVCDAAALARTMGISLDEVCRLSMANDRH